MAKRIFLIADSNDKSPKPIFMDQRRVVKALIRCGQGVQRFSYRNVLTQFNLFSGKHLSHFMPTFVRRRADGILATQMKKYEPDIVIELTMKYLPPETASAERDAVLQGKKTIPDWKSSSNLCWTGRRIGLSRLETTLLEYTQTRSQLVSENTDPMMIGGL